MADEQNVILLTIDSLRADRCGFMGYDENVTPTLDSLAKDGLVFENAVAPSPTTTGSVPAFHTGQHLITRELYTSDLSRREWCRKHMNARQTLAERMSKLGYETAAFTTNPWTSKYFGFDKGFDYFEDFMDEDISSPSFKGSGKYSSILSNLSKVINWWQGQDMFMTWSSIYDDILSWINRADNPYFLWIFLVDVHLPYIPPPEYRRESLLSTYMSNFRIFAGDTPIPGSKTYETLMKCYDDNVKYIDSFVEQLLGDLDGDNPLLFFHSDHGEEFNEHGYFGHRNVYDEAVHVPMMVTNGPTGRVTSPFSLLKLPKLIVSLSKGNGYEHLTSHYATTRNSDPQYAVRGTNWKYVRWPNREELFKIKNGQERSFEHSQLNSIGQEVVDAWIADIKEKVQIQEVVWKINNP